MRSASKKRVLLDSKLLDVPFDTPVFVVTSMPWHTISLSFESKLKDSLNKFFATCEPELIDYSEVYRVLRPLYSSLLSPLSWFDRYAEKSLIILDQEPKEIEGRSGDHDLSLATADTDYTSEEYYLRDYILDSRDPSSDSSHRSSSPILTEEDSFLDESLSVYA